MNVFVFNLFMFSYHVEVYLPKMLMHFCQNILARATINIKHELHELKLTFL